MEAFEVPKEEPQFFFSQPSNSTLSPWAEDDEIMFCASDMPSRKRKTEHNEDLDSSGNDAHGENAKQLKDNYNDKDLQALVKKMSLQTRNLESLSIVDKCKLLKQQRLEQWSVNPEMIYMIHAVRKEISEYSSHFSDEKKFVFFYRKLFDRWKEVSSFDTKAPGYIQTDKAICLWYELLSERCPFLDFWAAFLIDQDKRYISKDCWNIFIDFCREFSVSFAKYDFEGYWPTVTDEFVRFLQKNGLLSQSLFIVSVNSQIQVLQPPFPSVPWVNSSVHLQSSNTFSAAQDPVITQMD